MKPAPLYPCPAPLLPPQCPTAEGETRLVHAPKMPICISSGKGGSGGFPLTARLAGRRHKHRAAPAPALPSTRRPKTDLRSLGFLAGSNARSPPPFPPSSLDGHPDPGSSPPLSPRTGLRRAAGSRPASPCRLLLCHRGGTTRIARTAQGLSLRGAQTPRPNGMEGGRV